MTEEITVQSTFDADTMTPAYKWHWRRRRRWWLWAIVVVASLLAIWEIGKASAEDDVVFRWVAAVPVLLFTWLMAFAASPLRRWSAMRILRRAPAYGKSMCWTARHDGLEYRLDGSEGTTAWSLIYESVATPDGCLVNPQKNLFYWFPKAAFTSEPDYQRFLELLKAKTKHSTAG